jgi:hypothetical protein
MGRSSNQCGVHIHIDRKLGLFSFSKYYRVSTRQFAGVVFMTGSEILDWYNAVA